MAESEFNKLVKLGKYNLYVHPGLVSLLRENYDTVQAVELADELKALLEEFVLTGSRMVEKMHSEPGHRDAYLIQSVLEEAAGEKTENLCWEVALELIRQQADKMGMADYCVLIEKLIPMLRNHLGAPGKVSLREINEGIVGTVCRMSDTLLPPKDHYVASNAVSLAQAIFSENAWFRAIYAGEEVVGFLMLYDDPEEPVYFLWRLMIAAPHHGRGFGKKAIQLLAEHVRSRPKATELMVSYGQGPGSPEMFYRKLGFIPTGEMEGTEIVASLKL